MDRHRHIDQMFEDELILGINGLNMDAVWDNFIIQIGSLELEQGNSIDEQIAINGTKTKLIKDIEKPEKRVGNKKQPNKKFQLASQVKELKKELEGLENRNITKENCNGLDTQTM